LLQNDSSVGSDVCDVSKVSYHNVFKLKVGFSSTLPHTKERSKDRFVLNCISTDAYIGKQHSNAAVYWPASLKKENN
jgi:hypothetical protein